METGCGKLRAWRGITQPNACRAGARKACSPRRTALPQGKRGFSSSSADGICPRAAVNVESVSGCWAGPEIRFARPVARDTISRYEY
jgi:hypothetical protein